MSDPGVWDVSLRPMMKDGEPHQFVTTIPKEIGLALRARGFNRARLRITEEGILLVPYAAEVEEGQRRVVSLPDWNGA